MQSSQLRRGGIRSSRVRGSRLRSLQIKFSALVVTLLVVASVSLAVIATQHERSALEAEVEKRGRAVAKHLAGAAKFSRC